VTARTPSAAAALPTARRSGYLVWAATVAFALGGIALASPAAAVDDPSRPDARITHGPSCHPGGVVVEVAAGTVDYAVTFATTRAPAGEDSADVPAGETVVLRTGDVAWGETIDGRLEFTALDGSGESFVDELDGYTFTRPSEEDCAAIAAPAAAATVPSIDPDARAGQPVTGAGADGVRPDGTRPGGTDAAGGPVTPAEEAPGTTTRVDLVETAAPASLPATAPLAPVVTAAVALAAAATGLVGVAGRSRRTGRTPTRSA
jgi:hypothetical protein